MVRALHRAGWDALAWNMRGCSGEINQTAGFTHAGRTEDLDDVFRAAGVGGAYREFALIGFSYGANLTLKYVGERGSDLDTRIGKAVAISATADLTTCSERMNAACNRFYLRRFLTALCAKVEARRSAFPSLAPESFAAGVRTFADFDGRYTAPIHGFRDTAHYWNASSGLHYLDRIRRPLLLINAKDDPLLTEACFPEAIARAHPFFYLETPTHGGHVGFLRFGITQRSWLERRTMEFLAAEQI
jgi:hypothetical protein